MIHTFCKTCIGYSHIKVNKVCQDFTSVYKDSDKTIITCCDGHGGDVYVRSDRGSSLASRAINKVFQNIKYPYLLKTNKKVIENQVKLLILCEWNKLVERDYGYNPFTKAELSHLTEEELDTIRLNPATVYGTTLAGAMLFGSKILVVSIGDTEVMGIIDDHIEKIFKEDSDPVGNITYSMCQEDAFDYLRVKVLDISKFSGVLLCTDGLSSPYQSYDNFNNNFVKPVLEKIVVEHDYSYIENFIEDIALKLGVGDDVSIALLLNDKKLLKLLKE